MHPFHHHRAILATAAGLAITLTAATSPAQDAVDVTSVVWPTDTSIDVQFTTDADAVLRDLVVQVSSSMEEGTWALFGDVILTPLGGGAWRASIPAPSGSPRRFFRVLKDGVPIVTTGGSAGEGASALVANFSGPFTGDLGYTIEFSDGSPAQAGTVTIDGASTAMIPVAVPDDTDAETLHYLTLTLTADGEGIASYTLGAGNPITIAIEDNDSIWAGILDADEDGVDLAVTILTTTEGGATSTCFKTDGAGILPANPADPDGCWPFTAFALDDDSFEASVEVVVPAADTIYGADTVLTLTFTATDPAVVDEANPEAVTSRRIDGLFALATTVPPSGGNDYSHLTFPPRTGSFTLFRRPAVQPEVQPLTEAP